MAVTRRMQKVGPPLLATLAMVASQVVAPGAVGATAAGAALVVAAGEAATGAAAATAAGAGLVVAAGEAATGAAAATAAGAGLVVAAGETATGAAGATATGGRLCCVFCAAPRRGGDGCRVANSWVRPARRGGSRWHPGGCAPAAQRM